MVDRRNCCPLWGNRSWYGALSSRQTQETPMRKSLCCSAVALMLCSAGYAVAQGQPDQPTPPGQATSPMHTIPPTGAAQPQAPLADQAKPAAVGPAQAAASGQSSEQEVPGATRQT